MKAANYRAVIVAVERPSCKYDVTLYFQGVKIDSTRTSTRWGAREWARNRAKVHKNHQPHREEYYFNA